MIQGDDILIATPNKALMKSVGARWSTAWNAWSLPATRMNGILVDELGLGPGDLSVRLASSYGAYDDERLFPYQREAVERLVKAPHGQLLALSPGLGKTAVAIVAADEVVKDDRIVVVAPASLLRTWEREITKWRTVPGEIYVMKGQPDYEAVLNARWIIVSWEKATRLADDWGTGWPLWILDESVLVKSRKAKRFKALGKLRKAVGRYWLLSGSPTTKFQDDLWTQLHLIWPRAYPSYWRFTERYCIVEENPWTRAVIGDTMKNAAEENDDLIHVVNQDDVLDLPDYLHETIDVELGTRQRKHYTSMQNDFVTELLSGDEVVAVNEIAKLGLLQQVASAFDGDSAKATTLRDIIKTYEPPYLIWTHWKSTADAVKIALEGEGVDVAKVTGATKNKDEILQRFKDDELEALVLSLGVGKFGHTFTNVKTMFYVDKSWNADDYFQSLHRVRRIGLTHRPVVVTLRAPGTVDELVEQNLEQKLGSIARMTKADLAKLLKGLR